MVSNNRILCATVAGMVVASGNAFAPPTAATTSASTTELNMGLFDNFKVILMEVNGC